MTTINRINFERQIYIKFKTATGHFCTMSFLDDVTFGRRHFCTESPFLTMSFLHNVTCARVVNIARVTCLSHPYNHQLLLSKSAEGTNYRPRVRAKGSRDIKKEYKYKNISRTKIKKINSC